MRVVLGALFLVACGSTRVGIPVSEGDGGGGAGGSPSSDAIAPEGAASTAQDAPADAAATDVIDATPFVGTCSGKCLGLCEGTCSINTGDGGCIGTCEGTCTGHCET